MKIKLLIIVCLLSLSSARAEILTSSSASEADSTATVMGADSSDSQAEYSSEVLLPEQASELSSDEKTRKKKLWMPRANRIDREVNKMKFIFKGELAGGINASYSTLSSSETSLLTVIDDIYASGTIASIKPFFGYFYRDNRYIGVRFGYDYIQGEIDNALIDLGESNDMSFDVPYISFLSHKYNFGVFHRSYTGLDKKGRFGLFAEIELNYATGNSEFIYENGGVMNVTNSESQSVKLSFNPGVAVFIFPNVCSTLSFGLGGLSYSDVKQKDETGAVVGSRTASKLSLQFNIIDINIGVVAHLWRNK